MSTLEQGALPPASAPVGVQITCPRPEGRGGADPEDRAQALFLPHFLRRRLFLSKIVFIYF